MTRTLLVALDVPDPGELPLIAEDVAAILTENGLNILSVKPWESPSDELPRPPATLA